MQATRIIERRSLNAVKSASLCAAGAGVAAGLLANSDALFADHRWDWRRTGKASGLLLADARAVLTLAPDSTIGPALRAQ